MAPNGSASPPMATTPAPAPGPADPPRRRLITRVELAALLMITPKCLDRKRRAGRILDPTPTLNDRKLYWDAFEVDAWQAAGHPTAKQWRAIRGQKMREGRRRQSG